MTPVPLRQIKGVTGIRKKKKIKENRLVKRFLQRVSKLKVPVPSFGKGVDKSVAF